MGNIERYRQIAEVNQDSVYWQLTARFGTLHIKACHDFAEEAIKNLGEFTMNILVINGSPKSKTAIPIKLRPHFLDG